jgi:hypothetical protein
MVPETPPADLCFCRSRTIVRCRSLISSVYRLITLRLLVMNTLSVNGPTAKNGHFQEESRGYVLKPVCNPL